MRKILAVLLAAGITISSHADSTVVFNELASRTTTLRQYDWVELYNQLAVDMDLSGWTIDYQPLPDGTVIRGRNYLVVALGTNALPVLQSAGVTNFVVLEAYLADRLTLRNNNGRVMDVFDPGSIAWWPKHPRATSFTWAKRDPEWTGQEAQNWQFSTTPQGTPGKPNFPGVGVVRPLRLVGPEDTWRYYDGATAPPQEWRLPAFNDSTWSVGSPLYYHGTNRIIEVRSIPTLFNTGLDDQGRVLTAGAADPHYRLTVSAQGGAPTQATVTQNHPNWLANDSSSSWIGPVANGSANVAAGNYYYVTTFSLSGFEYQNAVLQLFVAVDNNLNQVLLNGVAQSITAAGFNAWYGPFYITNGFVAGTNTLEFRCSNAGTDPSGFRALVSGTAPQSLTNTPLAGGRTTYYFRRPVVIANYPEATRLLLRPMVDDGAVIYVNGAEILRLNLPEGEISASTPAITNVLQPNWSGPYVVYPTNLVMGTNWLAVELHQAAGGESDAVFGLEVQAEPYVLPMPTLVINELTGATNATLALEIFNYGSNAMTLEGCELGSQSGSWPAYVFSNVPPLPPGGFLVLTGEQLGWLPMADGYRSFENVNITLWSPGAQRVYDTVVLRKNPRARFPDGGTAWGVPAVLTLGSSNRVHLQRDIVINEIMYHPPLIFSSNAPPQESDAQWIELYNRGSNTVDLSGWMLEGGVRYLFPAGVTMGPGAYLVVANDATTLRTAHPGITILGDLLGRLSGRGELIILRDAQGNPADEVRYYDSAPWPEYADGGGSSLELRDPWADNSHPSSWAASDETARGQWQNYSYRMVATFPGSTQPTTWQDFVFGLLDAGECLVDDISVVENPSTAPVEIIANGNFENGLTGWRVLGNHGRSRVITDPDNPGNRVLHLVATGAQEHMHNHIETTLTGGRTIVNGREYQISFRARWLAGNNLLNTRLYFNRVARTSVLRRPVFTGTPGAPNSRRVANLGPTVRDLLHQPVVPAAGIPVTVQVTAQDPQGVAECRLYWSVNGGAWNSVLMSAQGERYAGVIPGGTVGDIVQFYVRATDAQGAVAYCPAAGPDSGALFAVEDGQAEFARGHNLRVLLTPANRELLHAATNVMSNDRLPGTIIYDEYRPYYDCGIRLKGSERGRPSDVRVSFHLTFPADQPFRGVHPVMLIDRSGQGDTTQNKQLEMVIKHMLHHAGGVPGVYGDLCKVIAPYSRHTSSAILAPRLEDEFIETAFVNGGDGDMYEFELIYYPTTTNAAGYKLPSPDSVIAVDFQNLGDDPELYRYNFIKKNHRDVDDYGPLVTFAKTFSLATAALDQQSRRVMDVDQWMRVWALVTLCGVGDTYTFGNDHNVMLYRRPEDNKFLAFPIDMDFSFSRAANSALIGDRNFSRLINEIPANKRRFYAHVKDIIQSTYNNAYMDRWIAHYNSFVPEQNYSAIPAYLATRISTANTEIANNGGNAAFAITSSTNLVIGTNLITLAGTAPVEAAQITVNGQAYPITWVSLSAWTMRVPVSESSNVLTILAYDVNGQLLTNFTRTTTVIYTNPIPAAVGNVGFTEIMYNPAVPGAEYVELYNASPYFTFDLSNWGINGLDYRFPSGAYLAPRSYLILAKNRAAFEAAYGTGVAVFDEYGGNLQRNGETLTLWRMGPGGQEVVDRVRYDSEAPWPASADGSGASLQLKDFAQRHDRVINWLDGLAWQFKSFTLSNVLTLNQTNLYFRFSNAGEVWLDDVRVEEGTVVGGGSNYVVNGDFEAPLEG
ncbi:MAG: lamin tail domain-containing protein, partial [Verrucomicrobiae bacterium]|nr:lamin tail domain-containing protein [Verrucomicrobiae bacterium]